jgi:hypothetical protein
MFKASFEFLFRPKRWKVPDTTGMSNITEIRDVMGYQQTHTTRRRTCGKETEAYPTISIPIHCANWRYPKRKRRNRL